MNSSKRNSNGKRKTNTGIFRNISDSPATVRGLLAKLRRFMIRLHILDGYKDLDKSFTELGYSLELEPGNLLSFGMRGDTISYDDLPLMLQQKLNEFSKNNNIKRKYYIL